MKKNNGINRERKKKLIQIQKKSKLKRERLRIRNNTAMKKVREHGKKKGRGGGYGR